jgi:serine/threonine-protein kinase RsbW
MFEVRRGWRRWLLVMWSVGAAYALLSQLSFTWFDANGVNASFFPSAGVTLAALVLLPPRWWSAVLVGAGLAEFSLDLAHDIPAAAAAGYTVANLAQPVVGALLLGKSRRYLDISRLRQLTLFLLAAVGTGPFVGGMLGATTHVTLTDSGTGWARFAIEWWVGDGLGVLVVGGSIIGLRSARLSGAGRARAAEATALIIAAAVSTFVTFHFDWFVVFYLPMVLLFVIAVRVGTRGVALAGAAVAFVAAEGTARGHRFWATLDVTNPTGLLYLQLALAVLIGSALGMSAALSERENSMVASATAAAATSEAELAQRRAELLGRLAERLGRSTTAAAVHAALHDLGFEAAWPADEPGSSATAPRQLAHPSTSTQPHPMMLDSARRMTSDALHRVRLIADERLARERAELLEQHAAHLAAAATRADVARATVEDLAALVPDVVEVWALGDHTLTRLASRSGTAMDHVDTLDLSAETPVAACARLGGLISLANRADVATQFAAFARSSSQDCESIVALPLSAQNDQVIGVVLLASQQVGWLTDTRRQLLLGVADQCGLALERAGLQYLAERAAADADLLARLGEELDRATTARDRALRTVQRLVEVGARGAVIRMDDGDEVVELAAAGEVHPDRQGISLPLQARGRNLGQLWVDAPEPLGTSNRQLLQDIVTRAAIAIDNALLYERERDVSHHLQLGLLDVHLPTFDNLELDAAYRPGTATLDIGGDWHDAFILPSGALALVVGDVVGHGLDAAITMSQLRGAVRALATISSPGELLDRLDVFVDSLPAAEMTTLVYVELEPTTGRLRYACAGHLPPLVVSATGVTRYLWGGRSTPLGSHFRSRRIESIATLGDAERLVLFTDGLTERRGESLDAGLDRLLTTTQHDVASPDFVDRLHRVMLEDTVQRDDVCVLVASRRNPDTFSRTVPPTPAAAAGLRHQLRQWLDGFGLAAADRGDVVLAVSEALANAVEHGSAGRGDRPIVVVASAEPAAVSVVVRDHGEWREPAPSTVRGRGLGIMRDLMDDVVIERHQDGTVVRLCRNLSNGSRHRD